MILSAKEYKPLEKGIQLVRITKELTDQPSFQKFITEGSFILEIESLDEEKKGIMFVNWYNKNGVTVNSATKSSIYNIIQNSAPLEDYEKLVNGLDFNTDWILGRYVVVGVDVVMTADGKEKVISKMLLQDSIFSAWKAQSEGTTEEQIKIFLDQIKSKISKVYKDYDVPIVALGLPLASDVPWDETELTNIDFQNKNDVGTTSGNATDKAIESIQNSIKETGPIKSVLETATELTGPKAKDASALLNDMFK